MNNVAKSVRHFHAVQFYRDDASLARTVAQFLAEGIAKGEPCLVVATPEHAAMINRQLQTAGVSPAELQRSSALQFLDARQLLATFMVGGTPDPLLFKINVGDLIDHLCQGRMPCPIRAYGEMVDLLWQAGNADGAINLEILWNRLAGAYNFSLLCGYAMGHVNKDRHDARFEKVVAQHSHVIHTA